MSEVTYDVRVYKTEVYKGKKVNTYTVRWKVGRAVPEFKKPFRHSAQAEAYRSGLVTCARRGEAFSAATGEPVSWQRAGSEMSWYEFACSYVDMKWKDVSAGYRRDIARALIAATPAMFATTRGKPDDAAIRRALNGYAFNSKRRSENLDGGGPVIRWLSRSTQPLSVLNDPTQVRKLLDTATTRLNGQRNLASTITRNRSILYNAFEYAVELKALSKNPLKDLKWSAPKKSFQVDRRCVVNPKQAHRLLEAVGEQRPSGPRLVAFFAVMYYAGLRPEEVVNLRGHNISLPPLARDEVTGEWSEPPEDDGWGELHFAVAAPDIGSAWTDTGEQREYRSLKHRPAGESRTVPCAPDLTRILRCHLHEIGTGPDDLVFWGHRGGVLPTITYHRAWQRARRAVLGEKEFASPLAQRPYDLRHACVSTWLNGGVQPTQVAQWAGHSVDVLLRIYAKCVSGQDEEAKRRILRALRS